MTNNTFTLVRSHIVILESIDEAIIAANAAGDEALADALTDEAATIGYALDALDPTGDVVDAVYDAYPELYTD